jgi:uncharacterized membrane protein
MARQKADRVVPEGGRNMGAETAAILLLLLASLCSVAFIVVYVVDRIPNQTQFLGLALGLSLVFLAAALIITGRKLVVTEELVEEYPPELHAGEVDLIASVAEEAGSRLTRRRLFKLALVGAGGALTAAVLTPAASFADGGSSTRTESRTRRPTSRRRTSTRRSPKAPTRRSSDPRSCSFDCRRRR